MKKFKKFASLLLAMVMVLSFGITASAASIVIDNTTTGKTYTAYKIFDATATTVTTKDEESGEETSATYVSYTISSDSKWYSTVLAATDVFTLTRAGAESTTYYVTVKDGVTDAQVIAVFSSVPADATVAATATGNGGTVTLSNLDNGYYYITTNNGTAVTITTTTGTITVQDKNQKPGTDLDKTVSNTEAQIGDTVTYTITSNVPAYDGTTKITNYTFTDTLDSGLTPPAVSGVTVTIKDASGNTVETGTAVTVTVSGQVITVSYNPTEITNYPADATITITYTATVNAAAAYANGNKVEQKWNDNSTGTTDEVKVYTYGFNLKKVDGSDNTTQLSGAKFKLYTAETGGTAIAFTKSTDSYGNVTYTVDPSGSVTEIEVGYATIKGLDADVTYYLEETQAPAGYNMVGGRTAVTVGQSTTVGEGDEAVTTYSYDATGINTAVTTIANNQGSELPSTGGIGTTIFYVVGTIMVLGAVVVLITRKRMSAQ